MPWCAIVCMYLSFWFCIFENCSCLVPLHSAVLHLLLVMHIYNVFVVVKQFFSNRFIFPFNKSSSTHIPITHTTSTLHPASQQQPCVQHLVDTPVVQSSLYASSTEKFTILNDPSLNPQHTHSLPICSAISSTSVNNLHSSQRLHPSRICHVRLPIVKKKKVAHVSHVNKSF